MKKSQKRQKRLVLVAMVLMIGLVAGMGAMTYSKYITTGSTNETATAAKWGFVVSVNAENLFVSDYKYQSGTTATYNGAGGIVVNGTGTAKVVAPGTTGSMTFSVAGTAEVLAKFTFDLEVNSEIYVDVNADGVKDYETDYFPIVWSLTKNASTTTDKDLAKLLNGITNEYIQPGGSAASLGEYTLSWEWPLETGNTDEQKATNNVYDTVIGMKANNNAVTYDSIKDKFVKQKQISSVFTSDMLAKTYYTLSFSLSINIEQVQEVA